MLKLTETTTTNEQPDDTLTLPYNERQKSRQPAVTQGGRHVGVFLPRGQTLRHGAILTNGQGFKVRVDAEPEELSVVKCEDPLLLARACYHLGNRHIALQILPNELRFLADHVLDQMLVGLGLTVEHVTLPFEPESGAYHGHGH
ncbi:urease accessory protein UreE [Methylicorpusculum sp.]|uniref:urease accessory protein UreE n=1 Tax=Methylicorpusculum sp. TaxID=2713644 RepID=UPI00271B43F6|nr:urease accessory protein UreE [Methylicorpusculum sp.]MDO8846729.1 urease accessory protein UreE [Methylicorpusculum sp.]MDP2179166.1 urease accessory protein UreE [Methylicorpusculum sp.]MDP3531367.1 urease accessory protein UreE [Methylicorpusculum sp.]